MVACLCAMPMAQAAAELLLNNGRVLRGTDLERQGSTYHLEMADGRTVTIPVGVVRQVRLQADEGDEQGNAAAADAPSAESRKQTRSRVRTGEAEMVAGQAASPPPESVLPPAAPPRRATGEWVPEGDWPGENWAETEATGGTEWSRTPSPIWEPEPAFTDQGDANNFNPSRWIRAPNSTWTPEDGFKKRPTSVTVVSGRPVSARTQDLPPTVDVASWYGEPFHGRETASGTPYDMNAFTAAHRDLRFGTLVMVTDLASGHSVIVEINDRGPSVPGRTINLSRAAAAEIGMLDQGLAAVQVQAIPGAERVAPSKP